MPVRAEVARVEVPRVDDVVRPEVPRADLLPDEASLPARLFVEPLVPESEDWAVDRRGDADVLAEVLAEVLRELVDRAVVDRLVVARARADWELACWAAAEVWFALLGVLAALEMVAALGLAAAVPEAGVARPPAVAELLPAIPVLVGVVVAMARLSFRCMPWFRAASSRRCSDSRRL